jgi:hypothetical protein
MVSDEKYTHKSSVLRRDEAVSRREHDLTIKESGGCLIKGMIHESTLEKRIIVSLQGV